MRRIVLAVVAVAVTCSFFTHSIVAQSIPSDGTVLERSDGTVFVIRDGKKFALAPAANLSDADIDAIPDGGTSDNLVSLLSAPPISAAPSAIAVPPVPAAATPTWLDSNGITAKVREALGASHRIFNGSNPQFKKMAPSDWVLEWTDKDFGWQTSLLSTMTSSNVQTVWYWTALNNNRQALAIEIAASADRQPSDLFGFFTSEDMGRSLSCNGLRVRTPSEIGDAGFFWAPARCGEAAPASGGWYSFTKGLYWARIASPLPGLTTPAALSTEDMQNLARAIFQSL